MTGERLSTLIAGLDEGVLTRERELPQPGGREPAPGELVLLQSFLNTYFALTEEWGADLLGTPERLFAWFSSRLVSTPCMHRPSQAQVRRVLAVREGLRELARRNRDPEFAPDPGVLARMNEASGRVSLGFELDSERVVLSARGEDSIDTGVVTLLAIAAWAMIDGRWQRLKACPGEHCGWVFYDHSRNNSSRWCSMAVCGGRAKAKSHYRRRRTRTAEGTWGARGSRH
jgi:predicted RNA-binding Zn ribbon-like protein